MATAFNRVRYLYSLGLTDTASLSVTVAGAAPGGLITDYAGLLSYAEALMDAYTVGGTPDPYTSLKSALSAGDHFTGVNAQYVVGTQVVASAYGELGSPEAGAGSARDPLQCAWVVSLRTDEAGRSARGRCYFPGTGVTISDDGYITSPNTANFAGDFGNLLTDVCSLHTDATAEIQVYSRTLDRMLPVTRVLVDSRPDSQRRRANKQQSVYQTSTTYPA